MYEQRYYSFESDETLDVLELTIVPRTAGYYDTVAALWRLKLVYFQFSAMQTILEYHSRPGEGQCAISLF